MLQKLLKDPVIQECRLRKPIEDLEGDDVVTNVQTKTKIPQVCTSRCINNYLNSF